MTKKTEEGTKRFPTYSTGDAMAAFGLSRRKTEFYVQVGVTSPSLPAKGRGRGYSYYDLLRLGIAERLERVKGVAPRNLRIYLRWLNDERLAKEGPLKFGVVDEETRIIDMSPEGVFSMLQDASEPTYLDLPRVKKTLDNHLEAKYGE